MSWRVFYSYSHKDAELRARLSTYLAPLRQKGKIVEWHDRKIEAGTDWNKEISAKLDSAELILLLISADFLASEYCFGVEVVRALARLKRDEVKVVPILLTPCLWKESVFSALQIIPRDGRPITSWPSREEALTNVADEISQLVSELPPSSPAPKSDSLDVHPFDSSLELVRGQVHSYARLYERTRQRMPPSKQRTDRMEQIFHQMRALANASYPLVDELATSPSHGERLAALAILQVFASANFFPFLVQMVGSDKPFVGRQAVRALQFAVEASDPHAYPSLMEAISEAKSLLDVANVALGSDRQVELREAEQQLRAIIESLAVAIYDVKVTRPYD